MKILLHESQLLRLLKEQDASTLKAASGPQKCGLTKSNDGECRQDRRDNAAWDREVARQDKISTKYTEQSNKNFLSLSYDRNGNQLDRQSRKNYYDQYVQFMKTNPGLLEDGEGFNTEQKYAIVSKILDFIRKVPQISYSIRLNQKFGLNNQNSIMDVISVVNKMGGWQSFVNWVNSGGKEIK